MAVSRPFRRLLIPVRRQVPRDRRQSQRQVTGLRSSPLPAPSRMQQPCQTQEQAELQTLPQAARLLLLQRLP